jgi:hypothetical protein
MRQAVALGATLMPMSGLALLLQHDVSRVYPQFGQALAATIIAGVIIVEFVGPLLVQWGLKFAGEAAPDPVAAPATPHPPQAPTGPSASPAP